MINKLIKHKSAIDTNSNNIYIYISLVQIIACLGVFNGHFLMFFCIDFCNFIRSAQFKNTILSYFYMGDLNVQLFFVLGGFLIPLSSAGKKLFSYKKVLNKWASLIIPAIILTTLVFCGFCFAGQIFGDSISDNIVTSFSDYIDDILIFLTGEVRINPKEFVSSPYILSQLWFIVPFIRSWFIAYCIYHLCKESGIRTIIIMTIIMFLFGFGSSVIIGMLFGAISLEYEPKGPLYLLLLPSICLPPLIFSSELYQMNIMKWILWIMFGITLWLLSCLKIKCIGHQLITAFSNYTLAIYYIHWPIILILVFIQRSLFNTLSVAIFYFITLGITIIASILGEKFFFGQIKRILSNIL